ncbi:multicopper oxidase [Aspergillus undulatus]|uniref:multicopper oxidase n=1 Tax=Aspergillus undulatus TaxID=1810928 RepID=UPI003CCC91F6
MYLPTVLGPLLALNIGLSHAKRVFEVLELTWESGAPNGGERRDMIYTNGEYPGPDLLWDEDDDVEVIVINNTPFNTTMHWHGIEMRETPWSDGVPGLSQVPIQPGEHYDYRFRAYPAGTYWYHSHYKGLLQDGQVGAMYIRRKPDAPRPYSIITEDQEELAQIQAAEDDPKLVLVTDWTYLTSEEYHNVEIESGYNIFCIDNLLINGQGSVYCPGFEYLESVSDPGISAVLEGSHLTEKGCLQPDLYNVQGDYGNWNLSAVPGPVGWNCTPSTGPTALVTVNPLENCWASINFIDGAPQKGLTVSIDNHPMWVYEVDGQLVEPQQVEMVAIYSGARYAGMIKLDQTPGDYTIRVAVNGGDQVISAFGILRYANQNLDNVDTPQAAMGPHTQGYMTYGGQNTSADVRHLLFTENLPAFDVPPPPPSSEVSTTLRTGMTRVNNSYSWSLGHEALYVPEITSSTPLLFEKDPLDIISPAYALTTQNGTWVDIILEIVGNEHDPIHPPHPIHKHGNRAYIIGQGVGKFTWDNVSQAEIEQPESFVDYGNGQAALRDTFVTNFFDSTKSEGAWMALRYFVQGKFAGVLHCHIESHQVGGMALALLDGVDVWDAVWYGFERDVEVEGLVE